jgi:nitrogen fixation NifU-like protein
VSREALAELYREAVLANASDPYGKDADIQPTHEAEGHNPVCGDSVIVRFRVADGVIEAAAFSGESCAICTASSALLCRHVAGQALASVTAGRDGFAASIRSGEVSDAPEPLQPLVRVRRYPARVECAMLPWDTAVRATRGGAPAETE